MMVVAVEPAIAVAEDLEALEVWPRAECPELFSFRRGSSRCAAAAEEVAAEVGSVLYGVRRSAMRAVEAPEEARCR